MAICWERAVPLAFHLCCFHFSAVLIVCVPFPFWVSDHCLFYLLSRVRKSMEEQHVGLPVIMIDTRSSVTGMLDNLGWRILEQRQAYTFPTKLCTDLWQSQCQNTSSPSPCFPLLSLSDFSSSSDIRKFL